MTSQQPGTEIAGYRIESLIGRGGMAVVYRAEDLRLGRKVALKLLAPQLADNEQFRQRFIKESRLAASLDHPNIVPIYEAGEADGQLFIAMRYVLGSDLKGLLGETGGPLPEHRTVRLFGQIGDALDSAHRAGLVHRDVKPGNILVAADREPHAHGDHVYLTDFGLTKRTSELSGGLTGTGHFLGTVDYVSPEQIQGKPVGPGTDIYALGCVLYECLTGQLPFRRDSDAALLWAHLVETPPPVTGIRPEIDGAVNAVLARAMAKDPAERYESCQELVHDLELAFDLPAPLSWKADRRTRDSGEATRRSDSPSDGSRTESGAGSGQVLGGSHHPSFPSGSRAEPGTVTGDVPGGSQHPSFPSGRFPAPADASDEIAPPAGYEPDYEDYPEAYEDGSDWDQDDEDGSDWDQAQPAAAPPPQRRRWKLVAVVAVAAVLVALGAVLLRTFVLTEHYRTYTSNQTLVPFRLDHPAGWGSAVGPASDVVLAPDPTAAGDVFFLRGAPDAWASATGTVRSGSSNGVGLYVYTAAATFDTSWSQALQDSIAPLLPATTQFESGHREVPVAGGMANEVEADASDPGNPQTRLRLLVDVVQPPGAHGAVLLEFFAPPDIFENNRATFERIRDSLVIG